MTDSLLDSEENPNGHVLTHVPFFVYVYVILCVKLSKRQFRQATRPQYHINKSK